MKPMTISLEGTRGSIPCPTQGSYVTSKYGGNTTCVYIEGPKGNHHIVDMGSGMRILGNKLFAKGFAPDASGRAKGRANIYQSHLHHDHTQGLGFFGPIFIPGNQFTFYSGEFELPLEDALRQIYSKPWFPITLDEMAAEKRFKELREGRSYEIDDLEVSIMSSKHPDKCYAYRFTREGSKRDHSFVFLVDNEHDPKSTKRKLTSLDKEVVRFMRDADLVLFDSAYTPQEYAGEVGPSREGWGHSTYQMNVIRAAEANVGHLLLTHHDPSHDDKTMDNIGALAEEYAVNIGATEMTVEVAQEGNAYEV